VSPPLPLKRAVSRLTSVLAEKGGTLFRPVSKQRRPASEFPSKPGPSSSAPPPSETLNTMPPPSSIPQRLETPALSLASETQDAYDSQTRRPSSEPQRVIPNIVSTRASTPVTVGTSRKPGTPISIGSRSSAIPIPPPPKPISAPLRSANPIVSHTQTPLHLATSDNEVTQSPHTTLEPPSLSSPSRKRLASTVEPERSPVNSPSKRPRRSQHQTSAKSTAKKRGPQGTSAFESERSPGSTPEPDEGTECGTTPKPSGKRHRKKSPIPYDPGQPGIELDPTVVTMASICVDTGQGRVSSKANEIMKNHSAWKTANRERRAQMVAEMEVKKYGKILGSGGATSPPPSTPINPLTPQTAVDGSAPASEPATGDNGFDYSQTMSSSKFNVRVRIGPNGETVIDEESLYVDNSAEQDTHDYTHVEESDTTKFVNSATHSKKLRGSRWSAMETELFYDVRSCSIPHFC
jgi:transcription factor TFIIIB component B''